jgi:uncharacterized protein with PIN domain
MARYFIASRRGLLPAGGTVHLRFHGQLNEHLAHPLRQREFEHQLTGRASAKDVIESLGVPHTEIDVVLLNGRSVALNAVLEDGDRVAVYPQTSGLKVTPLLHLHPRPLRRKRFVLDGHLGKLARHLRLLGFDTLYDRDATDVALVRHAHDQRRILLTRDRGLLMRSAVTRGAYVYATDPGQQLEEVVERFDLRGAMHPFLRCMKCNGRLVRVSKRSLNGHLDEELLARHSEFRRCRGRGQVYWPGTHHARLQRLVEKVMAAATQEPEDTGPDE